MARWNRYATKQRRAEADQPSEPVRLTTRRTTPKTLKIESLGIENAALLEENEEIKKANAEIQQRAQLRDRAERHRLDATVAFQKNDFREAASQFSMSIEQRVEDPKYNALLYLNRAACYLCVHDLLKCIADCTTAAGLDPSLPRTYHRRADAYQAMMDFSSAYNDMVI